MKEKFRQYLSEEISSESSNVEKFFQNSKILEHYQEVRPKVQAYYENMHEELRQMYRRNYLVIEILQDEEMAVYCEFLLKKQLINKAIGKIANREIADIDLALLLVISEESMYQAIDALQEILEKELDEFTRCILNDTIFRVGIKFLLK